MNKRKLNNEIQNYRTWLRESEEKKRNAPDSTAQNHWQGEIDEALRQLAKLESQLRDGEYEEYCPQCGCDVMLRNYKCPKHDLYLRSP